ncbi:Uncharacterised protein [Mycobacterium tuberculosis]|uniref:Uncharacterized protein n=2 Tax=Mycobacterium tuberculosis TaxID=1773 RepID=A0A654ZWX4_MYCTX|nr:Uncharacterised protein [Mycobacterium tuberculosis]CKR54716.1 Uncharacterised protein [Mycobacterium tuberculosis]CKR60297.1 Uncharacterised protein [Mycobacterium tuberculosis]CKS07991.1 Uncharacterised protein [Mycobacterium tuberculosis]CKW28638.1 Uncharacterised protein [Mycobacterium tuberculosis]
MGQGSSGFEAINEHLERYVLIFVGGQAARSHLPQQFGEAGITGQVDPQHQGVDKKAHQVIQRRIAAAGDGKSDRHIGASAEFRQQHGKPGSYHHEAGRVVLAGDPTHLLLHRRRPIHHQTGAALIGNRWIGPSGGQPQPFRHTGQRIFPVGQLRGDRAVAVVEITEDFPLPQRVIDILHWQWRPVRCPTRTTAGICRTQIGRQRSHRPAVGGDMVCNRHQHMFVVGDPEKPRPQRYLGCQIEAVARRLLDGPLQPVSRPCGGIDDVAAKICPPRFDDQLPRDPVDRRKHRP